MKDDLLYDQAKKLILQTGDASVSKLQRCLVLGYTKAARLIDLLEENGVIGPYLGCRPREILIQNVDKSGELKTQ